MKFEEAKQYLSAGYYIWASYDEDTIYYINGRGLVMRDITSKEEPQLMSWSFFEMDFHLNYTWFASKECPYYGNTYTTPSPVIS